MYVIEDVEISSNMTENGFPLIEIMPNYNYRKVTDFLSVPL